MTKNSTEGGLPELILNHKGTRSFDDLSRACGGSPSGKRLHQMVSRPMRSFPDPDTIKGLARGLNVSQMDVLLAAARSLGLRVSDSDNSVLVLQEAGTLPPERQELIISVARALIEGNEAMNSGAEAEQPADADLTQDMLDLAAHKGDQNIGPYDLPE